MQNEFYVIAFICVFLDVAEVNFHSRTFTPLPQPTRLPLFFVVASN